MSSRDVARQWFVPGDGIDRHVISADIQRYLGNDATVRPGKGTGEHTGVDGYWIKAYRNLTSAMIVDLRADSARWRQEQRMGTRESYVGSATYQQSSAGRPSRREGDSPRAPDYGLSARERIPISRMPADTMDVDPPSRASMFVAGTSSRGGYPPEARQSFPSDRGYPAESPMINPGYGSGRPPAPAGFGGGVPSYPQQPSDGAPPGYVRQGNYFVPISSYDATPSIPSRAEPQYSSAGFGSQPGYPSGREAPRYGQPEYQDPSHAYPSPATTVSSVPARDRGPTGAIASYGGGVAQVQYDQYGRPLKESSTSASYAPPSRDAHYSRNPPSNMDSRDARRRR